MWAWLWFAPLGLGCAGMSPTASTETRSIEQVEIDQLKTRLDAGEVPILVDVRTAPERERGFIPGSIHIPLDQLQSRVGELTDYRDGRTVYLVCQSGGRSQRAAQWLAKEGFTTANVRGGTGRWAAKGLGIERPK
ncbi:MAG: rhodanese-like domain-containing protein [Myxococcota bacterium]